MNELVIGALGVILYPFFAAWITGFRSSQRIGELEDQVATLRQTLQSLQSETRPPAPAPIPDTSASGSVLPVPPLTQHDPSSSVAPPAASAPADNKKARPAAFHTPSRRQAVREQVSPRPTVSDDHDDLPDRHIAEPHLPPSTPRWMTLARTWLLSGNLVAKLGLVILFIGVGFLLKYVAATYSIPIELRLAAVVMADAGLLAWGWRVRLSRREIGLSVQGTAIAILMLVVFGAYQHYALIPAGFAFSLLVLLTVFTCLLAVLQEAPWLAAFGITGGFACPVLLATGQGSHLALFAYYALLNAGVFALAFQRAWHPLNLLGFIFTFVIGAVWGGLRYTPDHFWPAQAFLILFFLCYAAIPLAFAHQPRTRLKDGVDIALVIGTPLLAFGFEVGLVKHLPLGLAFATLGLGGFYLVLGSFLWRRGHERWRWMVETFAVVGVLFGTLTIPFALDARWTSAAWALEGAGFVWLGLRYQRKLAWLFGILLQAGAWVSFIGAASRLNVDAARAAHLWLGLLLLGGSAFAIAARLRRDANDDNGFSEYAAVGLSLSVAALLAACWVEATLRSSGSIQANWTVVSAILTALLLYGIGIRMAWPLAKGLSIAVQIAGAVALGLICAPGWSMFAMLEARQQQPLLGAVMLAVSAFASSRILYRADQQDVCGPFASVLLLWAGVWWCGPVINIVAGRIADYLPEYVGDVYARWTILYSLAVALTAVASVRFAPRLTWPQLRWSASACWGMLVIVTSDALYQLYFEHALPMVATWLSWALLWASGEWAMQRWSTGGSGLNRTVLKILHAVRTGGPWFALWPAGALLIDSWLAGADAGAMPAGPDDWVINAAWSNYLPSWAMMLVLLFLLRRSLVDRWPCSALGDWYRVVIVPGGTVLLAMLAIVWNLTHDGAMAPLPYLPLLNPLDLSTGFVLMLWASALRQLASQAVLQHSMLQHAKLAGGLAAYIWFNLILLRSAAHFVGIDYRIADLGGSQVVHAMLSLVWSASALVLMRVAARRTMPRTWWCGAMVLGVVVLKLFLVDLANGGSIARVISFVGVGLLLLLVGYFAPYPRSGPDAPVNVPTTV